MKGLNNVYAHQRLGDKTYNNSRTYHISDILGVQWSLKNKG